MTNQSQQDLIVKKLRENGSVSRNWALQNYISRLGAIICNLKKEGWDFSGEYVKNGSGKDFVYSVLNDPQKIARPTALNFLYPINEAGKVWKL